VPWSGLAVGWSTLTAQEAWSGVCCVADVHPAAGGAGNPGPPLSAHGDCTHPFGSDCADSSSHCPCVPAVLHSCIRCAMC
jgi:hypothetical protein